MTIHAYGSDVKGFDRAIEIKPDDRELFLGTFDLPPSRDAEQGRFPDHHRVRQRRAAGGDEIVFRRIRNLPLRGMARDAQDVAFSPDGKLLATAHSYNADPGEVMLWDMTTGARIATLPVADRGVASVAFSPDGKVLAGRVHAHGRSPGSRGRSSSGTSHARREVRRFGGHGGRISALAFSPDGKVLATSGADRTHRGSGTWRAGARSDRIDGAGSGRCAGLLARRPDPGDRAAPVACLTLWDVAGNRLRATLEPQTERFAVYSIAYCAGWPDAGRGRRDLDAKGVTQQGQVRLYDLAGEPFARRAVLTFDRDVLGSAVPNDQVDDVQRRRLHARRPKGRGGRRCRRSGSGTWRPGPSRTPSSDMAQRLIRPTRRLARRPMAGRHVAVRGRRGHLRHPPTGTMMTTQHRDRNRR